MRTLNSNQDESGIKPEKPEDLKIGVTPLQRQQLQHQISLYRHISQVSSGQAAQQKSYGHILEIVQRYEDHRCALCSLCVQLWMGQLCDRPAVSSDWRRRGKAAVAVRSGAFVIVCYALCADSLVYPQSVAVEERDRLVKRWTELKMRRLKECVASATASAEEKAVAARELKTLEVRPFFLRYGDLRVQLAPLQRKLRAIVGEEIRKVKQAESQGFRQVQTV